MCDLTQPAAFVRRVVKARLPHRCDSCGFTIQRGERYDYVSGIWDGEPNDYKRHELCAALEDALRKADDGCGPGLGELWDARNWDMSSTFCRAWSAVMRRAWDDEDEEDENDEDAFAALRCP
jgi:hypothetical protein